MKKIKQIVDYVCIVLITSALAIYLLLGDEMLAVQIMCLVFILWGAKSIVDYKDGSDIQLSYYTVSKDASHGERAVWCGISILVVTVSFLVLIKITLGLHDHLY